MALALAATGSAFAAVASPALATTKQFTASRLPKPCTEVEPCKTVGHGVGEPTTHPGYTQAFTFGYFKIVCKKGNAHTKTVAEGAVT